MKQSVKYALAAMLAGGAALATAAPAQAGVGFSIQFGNGYYDQDYYGYNYWRPCSFYFRHDLPAPSRCYRDFYSYYGPSVYLYDGFVFSNRGSYGHWRNNDRFHHWRSHDWRAQSGNDRGWDRHTDGNGWNGDRNNDRNYDGGGHDRNGSHDRGDSNGWNGDRNNDGGGHDRNNDGGSHDRNGSHDRGAGNGWNGSNDDQDGGHRDHGDQR